MTGKECCICKCRPARAGAGSCAPCNTAHIIRISENNQHFATLRHDVKKLTQAVYQSGLKAYQVYTWPKEQLLEDLENHFSGINLSLIEL